LPAQPGSGRRGPARGTGKGERCLASLRRTGKGTRDVYEELGAYESTPWGRRAHPLTRARAAAVIDDVKRQLRPLGPAS
jgi:hypothetical protein